MLRDVPFWDLTISLCFLYVSCCEMLRVTMTEKLFLFVVLQYDDLHHTDVCRSATSLQLLGS